MLNNRSIPRMTPQKEKEEQEGIRSVSCNIFSESLEIFSFLLISFFFCHKFLFFYSGQALLEFKMGMKNANVVLPSWREEDEDPCNWPGVSCDPLTKRVVHS